jgi:hypothetical protein
MVFSPPNVFHSNNMKVNRLRMTGGACRTFWMRNARRNVVRKGKNTWKKRIQMRG